jgi:hypothetical protein
MMITLKQLLACCSKHLALRRSGTYIRSFHYTPNLLTHVCFSYNISVLTSKKKLSTQKTEAVERRQQVINKIKKFDTLLRRRLPAAPPLVLSLEKARACSAHYSVFASLKVD